MIEAVKGRFPGSPVDRPAARSAGEEMRLALKLWEKPRACPTSCAASSSKASRAKRSDSNFPGPRTPRASRTSRAKAIWLLKEAERSQVKGEPDPRRPVASAWERNPLPDAEAGRRNGSAERSDCGARHQA